MICSKCEKYWKSETSLGWYEMKPPMEGTDMNILAGPYCVECTKIILSTKPSKEEVEE